MGNQGLVLYTMLTGLQSVLKAMRAWRKKDRCFPRAGK